MMNTKKRTNNIRDFDVRPMSFKYNRILQVADMFMRPWVAATQKTHTNNPRDLDL